ncbi:MAG: hypothetical protein KIT69_05540, partial [Propionibacteriaceae bacterium]|nr:hypothetical protein [Propionibacteriaceae bacterium]
MLPGISVWDPRLRGDDGGGDDWGGRDEEPSPVSLCSASHWVPEAKASSQAISWSACSGVSASTN